jgi:hypothetical protein
MQEHTVDFPGFSTALAGTEPSFSTAFTSPPARWAVVGSAEFQAQRPQAPAVRDTRVRYGPLERRSLVAG